jgi:hypothetical protein
MPRRVARTLAMAIAHSRVVVWPRSAACCALGSAQFLAGCMACGAGLRAKFLPKLWQATGPLCQPVVAEFLPSAEIQISIPFYFSDLIQTVVNF